MAAKNRKTTENRVVEGGDDDDDDRTAETESLRRTLRGRWELASVLNFLMVFEGLIKSKLKVSAEEIEMAIIHPNNILLPHLHILLLKGIPPVSKTLDRPDAWITAVCKKLSEWWTWVAEGDLPLTLFKGEEIPKYKELDPTSRLMILKALCEIRASQGDVLRYITDALKGGYEVSTFRKDKICGNENGTVFWLDGNATFGYRLYMEVTKFDSELKVKHIENISPITCQWETLATNLEEFRKVAGNFSSSRLKMEVSVSKTIGTDVIPVLEKLQKKKEQHLRQQQRERMRIRGFQNSGITRSCRNRRHVIYTFDAFDKAIDEAITVHQNQTPQKRTAKKREHGNKMKKISSAPHDSSDSDMNSGTSESSESGTVSDRSQGDSDDEKNENEVSDEKNDGGNENEIASNASDENNDSVSEDGSDSKAPDEKNDASSEDKSASNNSDGNDDSGSEDVMASNTSSEKKNIGSEDGRASNTSGENNTNNEDGSASDNPGEKRRADNEDGSASDNSGEKNGEGNEDGSASDNSGEKNGEENEDGSASNNSSEKNSADNEDGSASNTSDEENCNIGSRNHAKFARKPKDSALGKRIAEAARKPAPKRVKLGAKKRLRQRAIRNAALRCAVVADSEDESRSNESVSPDSDPDEDRDSRSY